MAFWIFVLIYIKDERELTYGKLENNKDSIRL